MDRDTMMEVENATTPTTTRTGKGTESEMVVGDGMQEELIHDESPSTTAAVMEVKYGYEEAVVQKHQHVDRNYLVGERKSDGCHVNAMIVIISVSLRSIYHHYHHNS